MHKPIKETHKEILQKINTKDRFYESILLLLRKEKI